MTDAPLLNSLAAAVAAAPDDLPLRLHLAELLIGAGRRTEAVVHLAAVLVRQPDDSHAQTLMAQAVGGTKTPPTTVPSGAPGGGDPSSADSRSDRTGSDSTRSGSTGQRSGEPPAGGHATAPRPGHATPPPPGHATPPPPGHATPPPASPPAPAPAGKQSGGSTSGGEDEPDAGDGVDWTALEADLAGVIPPRFSPDSEGIEPVRGDGDGIVEVEASGIRIGDVGGMDDVKRRLELAFFGPLRNPEMRKLYGKSLRGGLLLYGPPGCGKTFLARAVAGEMGAKFITVSIVDVLNMWIGNSERNLHEIFEAARRNAPCVVFLDELDALGHKRSNMSSTSMRTIGNQLLTELDGVAGGNDGVFVLAATNAPWDVDAALRRPGRFDRMCLVLPPDGPARAAILEYHLRDRPLANIDLKKLVSLTDDFSGADLAHLCDTAAENALHDSIRTGNVRMIEQRDFDAALREVHPTTKPWMATARNVAMFANEGGAYDDLAAYLKRRKLA